MAAPENRLSSEPVVATYLDPDGRDYGLNEDWEQGPIALEDASQGLTYQAWKLTFSGGTFTVTPEDTGSPVDILTGQDSSQCSFAFDNNARITLGWVDATGQAFIYWYDPLQLDFVITESAFPVVGLAMAMDDKRVSQQQTNDILVWYTLPSVANPGQYALYQRRQRDRYEENAAVVVTPQADPVWPYIHKYGMHDELRGQLTLSTDPPV